MINGYCEYCGTKQITSGTKYCHRCNKDHYNIKQRSNHMVYKYPERVVVLYVCPCDVENKIKHHFDYSRPFEVYLLCHKCHTWFHGRIRRYCDPAPQPKHSNIHVGSKELKTTEGSINILKNYRVEHHLSEYHTAKNKLWEYKDAWNLLIATPTGGTA